MDFLDKCVAVLLHITTPLEKYSFYFIQRQMDNIHLAYVYYSLTTNDLKFRSSPLLVEFHD